MGVFSRTHVCQVKLWAARVCSPSLAVLVSLAANNHCAVSAGHIELQPKDEAWEICVGHSDGQTELACAK